MEFDLPGKCVFCEFHKLVNQHYFGCKNPSKEVAVRSSIPMGGKNMISVSEIHA